MAKVGQTAAIYASAIVFVGSNEKMTPIEAIDFTSEIKLVYNNSQK